MKELSSSFFAQDTVKTAQDLLGKIISINGMLVRIVETEAYGKDPASHAFKRTDRSALMYDTYGHVYVYLIYGMYWCLNFTSNQDEAGAVLIRAVEPLVGIEAMKKNRKTEKIQNLCSGPGKLCLALGIDKKYNGLKLGKEIKLFDDGFKIVKIASSSRIGIKDALELQWRFFVEGNEFVSRVNGKN
ncbi:DNA-3-methyladenine glycosylase [Candidatus Woesearchaeota archaeon]|nr:DNA-3-methyladenine glycosylase [Candidatus Woesearchaeota archaeon]